VHVSIGAVKTAGEWDELLTSCGASREAALRLVMSGDLSLEEAQKWALAPEGGKPYGRRVLHESGAGEVLLVKWAKLEYSALHDHGAGSGMICFLHGDCEEEYWDFEESSGLGFREKIKRQEGDVCGVKAGEIHRVRALIEGALSLHFYVPTSGGMRVFEPAKKCYHIVSDDCGAWLPDPPQIVETIKW